MSMTDAQWREILEPEQWEAFGVLPSEDDPEFRPVFRADEDREDDEC